MKHSDAVATDNHRKNGTKIKGKTEERSEDESAHAKKGVINRRGERGRREGKRQKSAYLISSARNKKN